VVALRRGAHEELMVAVAAADGALEPVEHGESGLGRGGAQARLDAGVRGGVPDEAALADVARLQFELRLDEDETCNSCLCVRCSFMLL
jgi:hypothetical protein